MCGIALILSGAHIVRPGNHGDSPAPVSGEVHRPVLSVTDLKAALLRRGPDYLGSKKVYLQSKWARSVKEEKEGDCLNFSFEIAGTEDVGAIGMRSVVELQFLGATLQLRGTSPVFQPLVDASGNLLVYNGEIFGGINVDRDNNDAEALLDELEKCCSCNGHGDEINCRCIGKRETYVPEILSKIKGPWSLIYWQASSKTIWFGRDAFGRRSLLVHWPTLEDPRFVLSSVAPPSIITDYGTGSTSTIDGFETAGVSRASDMESSYSYWEELPCGIYSICFEVLARGEDIIQLLFSEVNEHEWTDPLLKELIKWERTSVDPKCQDLHEQPVFPAPHSIVTDKGNIQLAHKVLISLRESVRRRTTLNTNVQTDQYQTRELVPVALLFSGGLDSMIIAALLDQCLSSKYAIDLLNVSFDGSLAPDRISARAGLRELKRIAPSRRWQLVEIDADLCTLASEIKHLMSLINPARTYMDLNIGLALWLAAGGEGIVDGERCNSDEESSRHYKYKSEARVLLVGSGADEQCAGYGRHRTKYRLGGWFALQEEMKLDMQRIWKRNLGRDDRCISDRGKEARFPFLDEDVIRTLLEVPLWKIAELDQPVGKGDKKILREVARLLGLEEAAVVPKRAIQFGSRIARESNKKNFGSNRAANQASAGSVVIDKSSC